MRTMISPPSSLLDVVGAEGEAIDGRGEAFQGPAGDTGELAGKLKAAVKLVLVARGLRGAELLKAGGVDVLKIGYRESP